MEQGPGGGANGGQYEDEQDHDIIVCRISRAVGESGDRVGKMENVFADPGDEAVEGRDVEVERFFGERDDAVGIEEDEEEEVNETKAECPFFGRGPCG